ncbi:homeotic protein proboscipedia isoform X2 [Momordica charantia]|uniref:Homeotic protein proboscipedia isoform X2 n=1 Tax=Momordica charantia TaxID=3673 RepID=A0A6J1DHR9_MOMCH|nr:homeotic protein proboscipedia isoform X2 [Momordica charantia]
MEEELCSVMPSEENKDLAEKNKKRKLKTPNQVIALEKFYNEHKYPTEEMKSQLAEQLGLTEKQISGWFCHRRLKDKRFCETYASVRQDRSSGVIQDHGSGLAQDSCGSTKNGDYWHIDPREVESQKPYGHELPASDNVIERRNQFTENVSNMDNTSSESSSSLKDRLLSQSENPYDTEVSRYLTHDGAIPPSNPKVLNSLRYKPSGYLKVKGEVENAAITAVKRQLGVQYREDGPSLGVEFQPLPPGAFESPAKGPIHDSYYVGNPILPRSPDVLTMKKQRALGSRYEVHSSNMSSQDSYMEEAIPTSTTCRPESQDKNSTKQLKKSSNYYNKTNPFPRQNSPLNMYEESGGLTFSNSSKRDHRMSSTYNIPRSRTDSVSNNHGSYTSKVASEQTEVQLHNHGSAGPKSLYKSGYLDYNSKKMSKEIFNGEEKEVNECSDPVRGKIPSTNEIAVANRCQLDFPRPDYAVKASFSEKLGRKNHIRRSTMEMPYSFTVDEADDTSSSLD